MMHNVITISQCFLTMARFVLSQGVQLRVIHSSDADGKGKDALDLGYRVGSSSIGSSYMAVLMLKISIIHNLNISKWARR